jgi:hypothetical protein
LTFPLLFLVVTGSTSPGVIKAARAARRLPTPAPGLCLDGPAGHASATHPPAADSSANAITLRICLVVGRSSVRSYRP